MIEQQIPPPIRSSLRSRYPMQTLVPIDSGMSGARVYRYNSIGGESLALRCWPTKTSLRRVEEIHRIIGHVRSSGFHGVPESLPVTDQGATAWVDAQKNVWELARWMPGDPLNADTPWQWIQKGAEAIGRFHRATRDLGQTFGKCAAVASRLDRLAQLKARLDAAMQRPLDRTLPPPWREPLTSATSWLRSHWARASLSAEQRLKHWENIAVANQLVLRDVHREHILFVDEADGGKSVSSIIDFDAIRMDTPVTDLSRWMTSFTLWPQDFETLWETILAGYRIGRAFYDQDQEWDQITRSKDFVFLLAQTSTLISLANWIVWILGESRHFSNQSRVGARISELVRQVSDTSPAR